MPIRDSIRSLSHRHASSSASSPRSHPDHSFPIMRVGMTTLHREEYQDVSNVLSLLHSHSGVLYPVPSTLDKYYHGRKRPKFMYWYLGDGELWRTMKDELKKDCAIWKGYYAVWYVPGHVPGNKAFYMVKIKGQIHGVVEYMDMPKVRKVDLDSWFRPEMKAIGDVLRVENRCVGRAGCPL